MLATGVDRPVTRYLKFLKQKDWVERRGVHPFNVNGDYGLRGYYLKSTDPKI